MNSISEKHPDKARGLRGAGFFLNERPDASKWWETRVDGDVVAVPDDLDLWGKGEPSHETD